MKHFRSPVVSLAFCAALAISAGCAKNNGSSSTPPPPKVTDQNTGDVVATAILTTVKTGESIPDTVHNPLQLSGQGVNAKYHARYTFNSGANTAFKLMQVGTHFSCSGSDGTLTSDTTYSLSSKQGSADLTLLNAVALQPNTDYTLEVLVSSQNCSGKMDLSFDVLAWAEITNPNIVKAERARLCTVNDSTSPKQMLFFIGYSPYETIAADLLTFDSTGQGWTGANLKLFIESDNFCGTKFNIGTEQTSTHEAIGPTDSDSMTATATTSTGDNLQTQVSFDNVGKTATVMCSKGTTIFADLNLSNCTNLIADEMMAENLRAQQP